MKKIIHGIEHKKDNSFNHNKAIILEDVKHPFGTVYTKDNIFGYVANGYDWYKFKLIKI
jgi:hypothetical protein